MSGDPQYQQANGQEWPSARRLPWALELQNKARHAQVLQGGDKNTEGSVEQKDTNDTSSNMLDRMKGGTHEVPGQEVHNAEEGKAYLEGVQFLAPGEEPSIKALVGSLLRVAQMQNMLPPAVNAVRAMAFMLAESEPKQVNACDVKGMELRVESVLDQAAKKITSLMGMVVEAAISGIKDASAAMATSSAKWEAMTASYRDILCGKAPRPVENMAEQTSRVQAWESTKTRQMLLDAKIQGQQINKGASNEEVQDIANKSLKEMGCPFEHQIISAKRLMNGGVLLEMGSEGAAQWMGESNNRADFIGRFAPEAVYKVRSYTTVVQFIPLQFRVGCDEEIWQLERDDGLPTGSVLQAQWIKPAHRHTKDQVCGHAFLMLSDPGTANRILTNGLTICHKWVFAEKYTKEPLHCYKCQWWGHLLSGCQLDHDVCGTCSGRHRTATCWEDKWMRCVSCGVNGHPSWDRRCPTYISKCNNLDAVLLENQMPYLLLRNRQGLDTRDTSCQANMHVGQRLRARSSISARHKRWGVIVNQMG